MLPHSHNYYVHMHTLPTVIYSIFLYLPRGLMLCGVFGTNNRVWFVASLTVSCQGYCIKCSEIASGAILSKNWVQWKRVGTAGKEGGGTGMGKEKLETTSAYCTYITINSATILVLYSRKLFRGRKLLRISWFCGYLWKFSLKFVGMASVGATKGSNLQMFSPRKLYFHQFAKVFSLKSFPLYVRSKVSWPYH